MRELTEFREDEKEGTIVRLPSLELLREPLVASPL